MASKSANRPSIPDDLLLVDKISGGDDQVFLAWDRRAWCAAACKVFSSTRRAKREARILTKLAHPNIIRSLGSRGSRIMLMEFLEGPSLENLIENKAHRFDRSDALRISIYLASALNHIHSRGYFHMDVKPSNVIIVKGRPVLFDFDCARSKYQSRPPHRGGTDEYMAPEEIRRESISRTADVFSLGVTIFETLTGKLPFGLPTIRNPYPQLTRKPRSLKQYRRDIPRKLEAAILQCLAMDSRERPSLFDLMVTLHNFIAVGGAMWPETANSSITRKALAA